MPQGYWNVTWKRPSGPDPGDMGQTNKKKMNILYIYQYFGTPKGSWSTRTYELGRRWVAAGHKVTIITSPYDKSDIRAEKFVERQDVEGIELIVINSGDSNRFSLLTRIYRALLFSIVSTYYTVKTPADVVIASSGPITVGIPGLIAKWFARRKMVFEVRDLWPQGGIELGLIRGAFKQRLSYWFEALCYRNASLIVPASKGMERSILDRFPEAKTLVIPNASDLSLFGVDHVYEYPNYVKKDNRILVYTGSLGLMDSVGEIVEGFSCVSNRDSMHIVIIGDGAERQVIEARTRELGLDGHVHFLGLVPKYEIAAWYRVAWASFVVFKDHPVLGTVSPNKMFDSFAAGVPILQNTHGWISELVEETGCGINVQPGVSRSMAAAIESICSNEEHREKMSGAARQLAETRFNRDELTKEYLDALSGLNE